MKLTKYGFRLQFIGFSSVLSALGIIVSVLGTIVAIIAIFKGQQLQKPDHWIKSIYDDYLLIQNRTELGLSDIFSVSVLRELRDFRVLLDSLHTYVVTWSVSGGLLLFFMIPYLIMWILLKIKTSKQDIPGIEKIGTVYSYVSGSLEIIGAIAGTIFPWNLLVHLHGQEEPDQEHLGQQNPRLPFTIQIFTTIVSAIFLIFACLKITGIRVESNKELGIYLGFRYALFVLYIVLFTITITSAKSILYYLTTMSTAYTVFIVYFILDIGLTVIIHSIRVDMEKNTGTEIQMKNF